MSSPGLIINLKNSIITGSIGGTYTFYESYQNSFYNGLVINMYNSTLNLYLNSLQANDFITTFGGLITYNMINSKINYIVKPNLAGGVGFTWVCPYIFNMDNFSSLNLQDNSGIPWCYLSTNSKGSNLDLFLRKYVKNMPQNISNNVYGYNYIYGTLGPFSYQVNNISQPVTNPGGSSTRLTVGGLKNYSAPLNWKK